MAGKIVSPIATFPRPNPAPPPLHVMINTQHLHALKKHGLTIEHLALGSRNSVQ